MAHIPRREPAGVCRDGQYRHSSFDHKFIPSLTSLDIIMELIDLTAFPSDDNSDSIPPQTPPYSREAVEKTRKIQLIRWGVEVILMVAVEHFTKGFKLQSVDEMLCKTK